jgi:two-component system sensor histidine kinase/response regulator
MKSMTLRRNDVMHPEDEVETIEEMKKLLNGELDEIRTEKRFIRKDGTFFWGELYASPVKDEIGHINYTISVVVDVTERKIAEDSLIKSESQLREVIATKDKFFSIIAHDLKNPLSVISNMSSHLLRNHREFSEEKKVAYIQLINESSHILYKLLENLLEWSRAQTGNLNFEPKEFDLHELSTNNLALFEEQAREKSIDIEAYIEENSFITADYNMINTVMRNLISNALKFTYPGGKVKVFSKRENGTYSLFVSDTGIGIGSDDLKKLFRIDVSHSTLGTENEEGTGLGLILCKEFIDKHNGIIEVESKIGEGTTFIVKLPNKVGLS